MHLKVAIDVPSGKLVCANDFRHLYPDVPLDVADINETVGVKLTTEAYAKVGLLHGFIGNTCPSLYLNGNKLTIANEGVDKNTYKSKPIPEDIGERVGGIITDLWWYCIADYDDFITRGGKIDKRITDVINVEPGRYVLTHNLECLTYINENIHVHATVERSDEKIIPWKMPEEGVIDGVMNYLPKKYHKTKVVDIELPEKAKEFQGKESYQHTHETSLYLQSFIEGTGDVAKKAGYKIWGHLFDGKDGAFIYPVVVNQKDLKHHKKLAEYVLESFKERNSDKEKMERVKHGDLSKEEIDKHLNELIYNIDKVIDKR